MIMDENIFINKLKEIISILRKDFFIQRPFLCLQLSCLACDMLQERLPDYVFAVKSGNLRYKQIMLFKQDFKWSDFSDFTGVKNDKEFHAWVEINNQYILDLSISWTVCSDSFDKRCKQDMILNGMRSTSTFIIDKYNNITQYLYEEVELLPKHVIDAVLNGISKNQEFYFGRIL